MDKDGFIADIVEISERFDDITMKPFFAVVFRCENRPRLRFDKRVRIKEVR